MNQTKALALLSSATLGFSLFWITSHPHSSLRKRLPQKRYKQFSFLPNVQYYKKDATYHFHHWLILSIVYLPLLSSKKLRKSHVFHGLFLGGIVQGLLYKDRFTFTYPTNIVRM